MALEKPFLTIVSGLPRSGTSLMMQMVHASGIEALTDNIRTADEDNPKGYYEFEPVKKTREDPSWLETAHGKVVKMVHLLLLDLPKEKYNYRVIFMRRTLDEIIASQNIMLERQGKGNTPLPEDRLKEVFEAQILKVLTYVRDEPAFEIAEIWYNDLLKEPEPVVDQLNDFLGGDLDKQAMLGCIDPKLYRNKR